MLNLTFLRIVIDDNGFRRMKQEGEIYKRFLKIFNFAWVQSYDLSNLLMILPPFFPTLKTITKFLSKY